MRTKNLNPSARQGGYIVCYDVILPNGGWLVAVAPLTFSLQGLIVHATLWNAVHENSNVGKRSEQCTARRAVTSLEFELRVHIFISLSSNLISFVLFRRTREAAPLSAS